MQSGLPVLRAILRYRVMVLSFWDSFLGFLGFPRTGSASFTNDWNWWGNPGSQCSWGNSFPFLTLIDPESWMDLIWKRIVHVYIFFLDICCRIDFERTWHTPFFRILGFNISILNREFRNWSRVLGPECLQLFDCSFIVHCKRIHSHSFRSSFLTLTDPELKKSWNPNYSIRNRSLVMNYLDRNFREIVSVLAWVLVLFCRRSWRYEILNPEIEAAQVWRFLHKRSSKTTRARAAWEFKKK